MGGVHGRGRCIYGVPFLHLRRVALEGVDIHDRSLIDTN